MVPRRSSTTGTSSTIRYADPNASTSVRIGVEEGDAVPGVPAAEGGGGLGVVGEQEVVDRVLLAATAAREVRLDPLVDAGCVRGGACPPRRLGQDLHALSLGGAGVQPAHE